jgi:hypothetical protein
MTEEIIRNRDGSMTVEVSSLCAEYLIAQGIIAPCAECREEEGPDPEVHHPATRMNMSAVAAGIQHYTTERWGE